MKITLELEEFLDLLTYEGLFNYIGLSKSVCLQIQSIQESVEPHKRLCYVEDEPNRDDINTVWYPMQSWINECRRRKQENDLAVELEKNRKYSNADIARMILEASMKSDTMEVTRLTELLMKG